MRGLLCMLLAAGCVLADKNDNRRNKLPFVADAVGNTLPPPSNVPATVGSPVNLLTPDRYEFYTFDESGELVKRLMTLEEIQAIVAAGEEAEGLVTFANDNQPTVSFNINQPPYTKVHSVVTNVQNVLKAQMEAHKNKPLIQPTLDTPDVSDSWSLILPSIFGNTGVDIVLDKSSGSVTTPETETFEEPIEDEENSLSKEGTNQIISSSTTAEQKLTATEKIPTKTTTKEAPSTSTTTASISTTTTTTSRPVTTRKATTTTRKTTTTPRKPTTTTRKPTTTTRRPTTTTRKVTTTTPKLIRTTKAPIASITTSTEKPIPSIITTKKPITPTSPSRPSTTATATTKIFTNTRSTTTTTVKPTTSVSITKTTEKETTEKIDVTTKKYSVSILPDQNTEEIKIEVRPNANAVSSTEKNKMEFEKISTFVPVSTVNYITERTTSKPVVSTKLPTTSTTKRSITTTTTTTTTEAPNTEPTKIQTLATTIKPDISTLNYISSTQENYKTNITTITTQSVSPSTTVSSTEYVSAGNSNNMKQNPNISDNNDNEKDGEPMLHLFDVAQSISQIASDLNDNYQPIPTTSNLLDTTKVNSEDLESKEVLDMDIPSGSQNNTNVIISDVMDKNADYFVKISTIEPHKNENKENILKETENTIPETKIKENEVKESDAQNSDLKPTESIQPSTDVSNKHNIILNNIQKVDIMTTTISAEQTTMDPILSESMGDLLSQVVNEAPQSIVDSENSYQDDSKITTTDKSIDQSTTEENLKTINLESEITNKVKKETSSTTVAPIQEPDNIIHLKETISNTQAALQLENNSDRQNESLDKKNIGTQAKPNHNQQEENTKQNQIEYNNKEFVKITTSSNNKDVSKVESSPNEIKTNALNEKNTESQTKDEVKIQLEKEIAKNGNKTTANDIVNVSSTEKTQNITTTIMLTPNKITQSKLNKINSMDKTTDNNKNHKLPEPLPKVDDFKKKIQKVNIAEEELINERNNSWKLIPTLSPPKANDISKDKVKSENHYVSDNNDGKDIVLEFSQENQGLEVTTKDLGEDLARFSELFNELAFRFWNVMVDDIDKKRSFVMSPYSIFSMLAMIFMGARGATSGEMNEILKLDDMVTFNPHFTLKNVSDSIETTPESGVAVSAFIRELYSDRNKGKILTFYKERAQHFYNGHVEEINFKLISDIIRRRTNLLIKRYTWGKIPEYMKTNNIVMEPPLAAFTTNIFETDCSGTSVEGRDGEMYFVVSPNVRQRRLVPVPAVVYKSGFLAGYDPVLDATAAALGNTNTIVSTLFLMPGQQGNVVHADDLEKLEQRLLDALPTTPTWNRLLRTLLPRVGLELQIPRFSHKSTFNVSLSLKKMGLKDLFDGELADLGGLNGPSKDLYLSDMIQMNSFVTCGEGAVGEQHHIEEYPETLSVSQRRRARWLNDWDEPRDYQRAFHDPHDVGDAMHLPLHLRPRQARLPSRSALPARLKFDRPFLYFVRHNPSGMILYFGRYNPRLLP